MISYRALLLREKESINATSYYKKISDRVDSFNQPTQSSCLHPRKIEGIDDIKFISVDAGIWHTIALSDKGKVKDVTICSLKL